VAFTLRLLLEFAKAVCLLSSMFRLDATMRPLLMTFESRRVTLNGGDANFKSFVTIDSNARDRETNCDEFHCFPRQSLHCIEFCRNRGDAHFRACCGDCSRIATCSSDILCFVGEVAMFVPPAH
jgi:hypothetical protein